MSALLTDPRFWLAVTCALLVAFLVVLLVASLRGKRSEVVGAIRQRCEVCEDAWAVPSTDDDLDLCPACRRALDEASGRSA